MKITLLSFVLLLMSWCAYAQQAEQPASKPAPTVQFATDKDLYLPGDSLRWQCALNGFGKRFNTVTVQLWIENLRTGSKWQYRFPVINGYSEGAMQVSPQLPPGKYAFNFLLQANFFNMSGKVSMPHTRDSILNYLVLFKDKETMVEQVKTAPDGSFGIRGIVFQDTAMFSFSRPGRNADPPAIHITTTLDSDFTPVVPVVTKFITVVSAEGGKDSAVAGDIQLSKSYHFDVAANPNHQQLKEVVVKDRRSDKLIKDYQDAYVSANFKTADDITLDGLSNDDMLKAGDIYQYLTMHVPGLTATMNPETGSQEIKWRNTTPAIYIDEFRIPDESPMTIQPGEVAMIKVYRPGSGPLTGATSGGGAIAIYTKIGPYSRYLPSSTEQRNRFYVHGYDGRSIQWGN